eukprot:TRINITY_DN8816_c0_g1_i1.p1 TRINITY_DN8816_c0_g1~~TRINITY_DN8816_c0_g1_i1.p1  ORF type:complete len:427 (-),score=36.28 TRINITY_DN8816_c0_g1_i1:226-1482(-)
MCQRISSSPGCLGLAILVSFLTGALVVTILRTEHINPPQPSSPRHPEVTQVTGKPIRVLVTGAAGFIGFHLTARLSEDCNVGVLGLDDFRDYSYGGPIKRHRARLLKDIYKTEVIEADLCNIEKLTNLFNLYNFTHVAHLAAAPGVRFSVNHPFEVLRANAQCFLALLDVMSRRPHPLPWLTYASSSSVYGNRPGADGFSELDMVNRPASVYAATKAADELLAHTYHNQFSLRCIGLRFFTVYGPWGRPDMAFYAFTESIVKGKPVELFRGDLKRDFTYVDDIVSGVVRALTYNGTAFDIFNLGNSHPVSVSGTIDLLQKLLGKTARIALKPQPLADVKRTYADLSRSRKSLGYNPRTGVEAGACRFVRWYTCWTKSGAHLSAEIDSEKLAKCHFDAGAEGECGPSVARTSQPCPGSQ